MKLNLKVTKKDLIIFAFFSVILLYLSAVGVLNVINFINENEFYGLNPIEAFTPKYIFGTLLVFISVLIVIFSSVSGSIFEFGKGGPGITIGDKSSDGYSRWCTEKEMKKAPKIVKCGVKDLTAEAAGVVFINDGKDMWVDNSENHTLVIGVTGSGKTTAVVDPLIYSLCKHGESMVITDPKGEIYKNHSELLRGMGYEIVVLNFREPHLGNAWNPLTLPYRLYQEGNHDKAIELIDDVAQNIAADPKAQDPFWGRSSADYFAGCALGLMEDAKEEEVNINSISYMTTVGEDKIGAGSTYIKEYFTMKGEETTPYVFASNTINSPNETKGGILSTFRQKIRVFATKKDLSEMLSYSDFDMRDIGKKKTAVFMVIHDEKTTYHALATIFIKQCYETLISVAQENGGPLPVRTNFILDEFANMPALKDVTTMVTAARSRQIRFTFIIQNFAQLNDVYGKDDAETIRSNCGNLMYLLTTELAALEEISKLCGEVKSKKDDKTASKPLVTVSDLQKMKFNEVIILRNRSNPFRTQLKQGFNTDWGDSEYGKADFYEREPKELKLFDIKEFVTLRRKSMKGKEEPGRSMMGGLPGLAGMGLAGMPSSGPKPNIPSFDEFLAQRNKEMESKKSSGMPSFSVDDLVKRIDAKIAELEAQEKEELEAQKRTPGHNIGGTTPVEEVKPIIPSPENPSAIPNNNVSNEVKPLIPEPLVNELNPFGSANKSIEPTFVEKKTEPVVTSEPVQNTVEQNVVPEVKEQIPVQKTPIVSFGEIMSKSNDNNVKEEPVQTINKFNELMANNIRVPEGKPQVMISNPIDTNTEVPTLPVEPIINKAPEIKASQPADVVEINPATINQPVSNFNELLKENSVDTKPTPTINPFTQNVLNQQTAAPVKQPEAPTVINTGVRPTPTVQMPISVDTTAKVIDSNVSDDQYYDDFFEE